MKSRPVTRSQRWLTLALWACTMGFLLAHVLREKEGLGLLLLAVAGALATLGLVFRRFAALSLFSVSCLCSLAMAEFLVPLLPISPADRSRVQYAPNYWSRGDIGSQPNEGRFRTLKAGPDGVRIYDVIYSIGSDHFRITPGGEGGAGRVNFLGCSVTFGEGLQDHETLPFHFTQKVAAVKAKNFGFHGYGPQQALAILQSARDTEGQVNVFLTAPWHALRSACKPIWTLGSPKYELIGGGEVRRTGRCGDAGGLVPATVSHLLAQSTVYRAVHEIVLSRASDGDIELYLALIGEMARVSHVRGQRFVIGFIKADESFFRDTSYSNARVVTRLSAFVDDVIDLTLADRAEAIDPRHYIHDLDRHPSAEANRERARLLADRLAPYLSATVPARAAPGT